MLLLKEFSEEEENEVKFEAVVGNPPYQETIREASKGNNKNTSDIYQHFQEVAIRLAPLTCMIYPAKDFQRGKKNTLDEKLINLRIYNGSNRNGEKHIPHEDSVFGDAVRRIPGDVGIYVYDSNNPTTTIIYQGETVERTDKVLPLIKDFFGVAKKLAKDIETFKFSDIKKVCESNFVERNKGKTIECHDRKTIVPNGYTKVLTNNKEGSGGVAKWYYIKTDSLDRVPNSSRFKVVIASARLNEAFANPNNIEILDKNESFGRTKYCIYDTDILAKAEACKKYFSTCFAQCINLMTPEKFLYYLPDFDSIYTDIDWSKSIPEIDQQLYAKYNLTEEEISFIKSMIKPME